MDDNIEKCLNCGKELQPALEALNYITGEWDEHTFKCECMPEIHVSIG